jgi:uncharacterized protein YjbI with pentapeptide repeats
MALDQETTDNQLTLLATHRRTLAALLQQQAQFDVGHVPAHVVSGVAEARANISRIKAYLRETGAPVEDELNDEALSATSPTATEFERKIADQRALDAVLETYIRQIEELVADKNLLTSQPGSAVRNLARTRTLATLRRLDGDHNQRLILFLREARLLAPVSTITAVLDNKLLLTWRLLLGWAKQDFSKVIKANNIIDFSEADLRGADLPGVELMAVSLEGASLVEANLARANLSVANLEGIYLQGANLKRAVLISANLARAFLMAADLREADLKWASLRGAKLERATLEGAKLHAAILKGANLQEANLQEAILKGSNLQEANLRGAIATDEQLLTARLLKGATMPDGSIHE